jgi:hypothetical protein
MTRAAPLLTVFAVVVASGVIPGAWSNRWTSSAALERSAARLADLPLTLGDWDGQEDKLDDGQVAAAEVAGHLLRRYVNRRTGDVVSVLVLCGRPGPVSLHTPEVCYRGAGYDQVGARVKQPVPGPGGECWACRFQKPAAPTPENLRVFYTWNGGGPWEAPDNPRLHFARRPALYKLYVIRPMLREDEPAAEDPALGLLRTLLPASRAVFFPAPA